MTLRPDDPRREEFVRVLRDARSRVKSRQCPLVCIAIAYSDAGSVGRDLRQWIDYSMGPCNCVGAWLLNQGVPYEKLTREAMFAYRLRWIDHMIRYFGGKP